MLISGTREKSAVGYSAEPKQKGVLQRASYFSCCTNNSMDADILPGSNILSGARFLPSAEFSLDAAFLPSAEFSLDAGFLPSTEFSLDAEFLPSAEFLLDAGFLYIFFGAYI